MRKPRLYFSFRSPYSWLTVHRLREAVPDAEQALEWYPYWDPDEVTTRALKERDAEFHYVQMSRAKHLYLLLDTKRLAGRAGLPMSWPVDVDCWWELPHLAYLAARRYGLGMAMYDQLIAARWGRGEDICTPDVVTAAARAAGFDPALALGAPDDEDVRAEAVESLVTAYEDDVFGIPYLRVGRHRFWGYDRLDDFLSTWRGVTPPEREPVLVSAYDTDTAGGCG
jgi:2-hydroxychromene-2-carboxylate isomerase